jgi:hypothetical protein
LLCNIVRTACTNLRPGPRPSRDTCRIAILRATRIGSGVADVRLACAATLRAAPPADSHSAGHRTHRNTLQYSVFDAAHPPSAPTPGRRRFQLQQRGPAFPKAAHTSTVGWFPPLPTGLPLRPVAECAGPPAKAGDRSDLDRRRRCRRAGDVVRRHRHARCRDAEMPRCRDAQRRRGKVSVLRARVRHHTDRFQGS